MALRENKTNNFLIVSFTYKYAGNRTTRYHCFIYDNFWNFYLLYQFISYDENNWLKLN